MPRPVVQLSNRERRRRSSFTALAAGLFASFLFATGACGSGDDDKYPDESSFCSGRAEAECSTEVVKACAAPDATRCIAKRREACLAAKPAGTSYNPAGAETCIRAVSTAYSDAKLSLQENRTVADACVTVFEGRGVANDACSKDTDCKASAGLRCVRRGGSDAGTCQVPQRVQGGGSCTAPSHLCIEGFHCGITQHCDINSDVGEPCSDSLPCVTSARCSAGGTCERKAADGTACTSDGECANGICAKGAAQTEGLCVSQMTLAPNEPFCIDAR